jgi:DNA-binding PadR family transcriptional regulator
VAGLFGLAQGDRQRGPRVRRGDVRSAILDVVRAAQTAGEEINGYQVIQQIAERSDGVWKPSPGSVYPTIAWLQDEELVEDAPTGRKTLQLTESGREYVAEHAEEIAIMWRSFETDVPEGEADLRQVIGQTVGAIIQVASTGTPDQREKAVQVLAETRRKLYGLLAEGPDESGSDTDEE